MTKKIDLNNLDKSNWRKVKFSDIAINVRKTSKNPLKDGFTKAIGLGHIEPDNLNLLGYTDIAKEGTKFNKIFRKGQFLFGARRAYLRQMARATFDGVCTANIMVFDIKNENLINRDLFEFIIRSNSFINCAVNTSEGSLFPNAKWKYIAEYEFLLPPKDQQAQLAKLLLAMDEVVEKNQTVLSNIERIKQIEYLNAFMNGKKVNRADDIILPNESWKLVSVKEIVPDIEYGISISIPSNLNPDGIPIISTAEIDREGNLDYSIIRSINYAKMNDRVTLRSGDVLFNWRNSAELIGKSAIFNQPANDQRDYTFASFILRMRCDEESIHNKYLMHLFNFYRISEIFLGLARRAVNQANFNKNEVYDLKIPVPPYNIQLDIMQRIDQVEASKRSCLDKIKSSQSLQKSLINQIFS